MPSLEESRRQVREGLDAEADHEAILAGLQDEIDRHNALRQDVENDIARNRRSRSRSPHNSDYVSSRPTKFRFKHKQDEGAKDRHRERRRHRDRVKSGRTSRSDTEGSKPTDEAAHPFPREPAPPETADPDAFRTSLFDALADDEGAAAYWEGVYSQPIHVYARPEKVDERSGKLEQMNDEEYAQYVKEKMWERTHPEVVIERKRKEKERKEAEEEEVRRRERFMRRKERQAWEEGEGRYGGTPRAKKRRSAGPHYDEEIAGEFAFDSGQSLLLRGETSEYESAWTTYLNAWQTLLTDRSDSANINAATSIPWPVLAGKPVLKHNIEAFMHNAPADAENGRFSTLRSLKAERVRWHPDKIQQRFGSKVEEGTMKLVTGVFQIIDGMLEVKRKKAAAAANK